MRTTLQTFILMAACLCLLNSCRQRSVNKDLPHIVIIFADDLGYGDVSILNPEGKVQTPSIDRLARNGVLFTEAHASGSVCIPSRYGLLTGRYAWRNDSEPRGPWGFLPPYIESGRMTIASFLQQKGYATACIGKWHLGLDWATTDGSNRVILDPETDRSNVDFTMPVRNGPNAYGFDYSFIHPASTDMTPYMFIRDHQLLDTSIIMTTDIYPTCLENTEKAWDAKHVGEGDVYWGRGIWWRNGEMSRSFRLENCLHEIMEQGISYIERQAGDAPEKPFFLYLPLTGPHTPWLPSESFRNKSSLEYYGDFVRDIDRVVERVTETLSRLEISEKTMVVFASDNGAPWPAGDIRSYGHDANYGRRGQKGDVWDGGHRIPLIISHPGTYEDGLVYEGLVSLTDVFATIARISGEEVPRDAAEDSFSFLEVLEGGTEMEVRDHMVHQSSRGMFALRKDGWKYIDGLGSGGFTDPAWIEPGPDEPGGQLYNIRTDPMESVNLFQENEEKVRELKDELERIIEQGQTRIPPDPLSDRL